MVAVIIAVGLACGEQSQPRTTDLPTKSPSPHPEKAAPPPTDNPTPTIDPASVRVCEAADLDAFFGGTNGLTGGQLQIGIILVNSSETACSIGGVPDVTFQDSTGAIVPITKRIASSCPYRSCGPVALIPGARFISRQSSPGTAGFVLIWATRDVATGCSDPPPSIVGARLLVGEAGIEIEVAAPMDERLEIRPCGSEISILPIVLS